MRDIVSQGEEREPRQWPRGRTAIAVLAVVATILIVGYFPRHRHAPARPSPAAITASPVPLVPPDSSLPGVPQEPDGVIGQALLRDGSLQLPVTGDQPAWFWPATGRGEPIGGLPRERSGYLFRRISGGWAVQPAPATRPGCSSCAGLPLPVYFLADRARSVTQIGTAGRVAPGATAGTVWLTSYPPGADMSTAAGTAREVSLAGPPLRSRLRLPAGYVIDRATDRGLLLAAVAPRPGLTADELWNPAAAQVSRRFDEVIAAGPNEVAWAPHCTPICRVHVLDLATGRQTVVGLPAGTSAANAAFSPDGGYLALQVSFGSGGDDGGLAMQLEVASLASGRLTVVPGTWVSSDALVGFGWPGGGDSLVAELSFTTKVQVASWRPGATRLAVTVIRRGQDSSSLIVG